MCTGDAAVGGVSQRRLQGPVGHASCSSLLPPPDLPSRCFVHVEIRLLTAESLQLLRLDGPSHLSPVLLPPKRRDSGVRFRCVCNGHVLRKVYASTVAKCPSVSGLTLALKSTLPPVAGDTPSVVGRPFRLNLLASLNAVSVFSQQHVVRSCFTSSRLPFTAFSFFFLSRAAPAACGHSRASSQHMELQTQLSEARD